MPLPAIDAPRERVGWRRGCGDCSSERGAALLNDDVLLLVLLGSAAAAAEEEEATAALLDEIDRLYALPPHELRARFLDLHGPRLGPDLVQRCTGHSLQQRRVKRLQRPLLSLLRLSLASGSVPCWLALFAYTPFTHSGCSGFCIFKLCKNGSCPL